MMSGKPPLVIHNYNQRVLNKIRIWCDLFIYLSIHLKKLLFLIKHTSQLCMYHPKRDTHTNTVSFLFIFAMCVYLQLVSSFCAWCTPLTIFSSQILNDLRILLVLIFLYKYFKSERTTFFLLNQKNTQKKNGKSWIKRSTIEKKKCKVT